MSGLLALLDDVAALTKMAAAQLDDVAAQTVKVSAKAVGVVVDDAAMTPKFVHGLPAARELPIVWKIARSSFFNKLVILLPIALLLNQFAPWLLTPLLMLGGCYLCFEGAEKIWHLLAPGKSHAVQPETLDAAHLEKQRVAGAIKTDFILSAEIMTIALAAIESDSLWIEGAVLALVAVGITTLVYGTVAILVKADDVGLKLTQIGRLRVTRAVGRGIVKGMPAFMATISAIGTAAMLWVGGSIVIHGLEVLGFPTIGHLIHNVAAGLAHSVPSAQEAVIWGVTAALDGVFGVLLGFILIPVVTYVIAPVLGLFGKAKAA